MAFRMFVVLLLVLVGFVVALLVRGGGGVGEPIATTQRDSLDFLVSQSDLIAIVQFAGGTSKNRVFPFLGMPKQIDAHVVTTIKGEAKADVIKVVSSPKFFPKRAIRVSIVLRNGRHLVFLSQEGALYKPTTRFSLLDVSNNKVYPIWKQSGSGNEITSGYALEGILDEINNELTQAQGGEGVPSLRGMGENGAGSSN